MSTSLEEPDAALTHNELAVLGGLAAIGFVGHGSASGAFWVLGQ